MGKLRSLVNRLTGRGRKPLSKKQKVINKLQNEGQISWSFMKNTLELESPRSMVDTLRAAGYMIYGNLNKQGKRVYRLGTPTKAIIAAGINALYGTEHKYVGVKVPTSKMVNPIN